MNGVDSPKSVDELSKTQLFELEEGYDREAVVCLGRTKRG